MNILRLLLPLLLTAPLLSQAPAPTPGSATPNPINETAASDDRLAVETLKVLELFHYAENAKTAFLTSANKHPKAPQFQESINCVAQQFTNKIFEPHVRKIITKYMTIDQLVDANNFFSTPLGAKLLQPNSGQLTYSKEENAILQKVVTKPFFKAFGSFAQKGLLEISDGPEFYACLKEFKGQCNQFPHPW